MAALLISFPIRWAAVAYQLLPDAGRAVLTDVKGRSILKVMPLDDLERLGMAGAAPAVIILVAGCIAPRFKFATSIILATVISAFILGAHLLQEQGMVVLETGGVPTWIMYVLWAASIMLAVYVAKSNWDEKRASASPSKISRDVNSGADKDEIPADIKQVQRDFAEYGVVLARDITYPDAWTLTRPGIDRFARVIRVASRVRYVTGPDVKDRYLSGNIDRTTWLVAMVLDLPRTP